MFCFSEKRACTIILVAAVVVWFLQTFDLGLNPVADSQDSILAVLAGWIAPVFRPLGFGDWRISSALISGFMAKESVVSTLTVLLGTTGALTGLLAPAAACALLVFCLLYTPCVTAVASIRRELGWKWAVNIVLLQCGIAWICALIVHTAGILLF